MAYTVSMIHMMYVSVTTDRTKRMVVDVLKVQPGDNLTKILYTPATPEQVNTFEVCTYVHLCICADI